MNGTGIVVAGATGYVGGTLAREWLEEGREVLAIGRDTARLAALADAGARTLDARALVDDDDPRLTRAMADLAAAGEVTGVVAAVGGWWQGPRTLDLSPALWQGMLESHLTAHWQVARRLVPLLPPSAVHVVLNGAASHQPMVGSGPVNVTGAALSMLVRVLAAESSGVRHREVIVEHAIAGDGRNLTPDREVTLPAVLAGVERALGPGTEPVHVR